ncbi:glycosyl hydrolase-like protein, partial [Aureobasidium melanogenum]
MPPSQHLLLALREVILGQEHLGRRILRCRAGRRERQLEDTVLKVEPVRHNTPVCRCLKSIVGVFEAFIRSTDNVLFSIDGLIDVSPEALPSEYDGDSGVDGQVLAIPVVAPVVGVRWYVRPERETCYTGTFKSVVIRIHCERLAGKVASLVSVFVVHVVRNTNLCEDSWTRTHLLLGFFTQVLELVAEAVSDGTFTNLYRESRAQVFAAHDTNHINIPESIPGDTIVEVRSEDSLRVVIFRAFDRRRDNDSTRSCTHPVLGPETFAQLPAGVSFPAVSRIIVICWTKVAKIEGVLLHSPAETSKHGLEGCRCGTLFQVLVCWPFGQIFPANVAFVWLVHAFPSNDDVVLKVSCFFNTLSQNLVSAKEVSLEIVLDVHAVEHSLGGEFFASKEEGENGLTGEALVVGGPDHLGEFGRFWPCVLNESSLCSEESLWVQTASIDGPHRGTRATCESRPDILVRVHEDVEAVLLGQAQDVDGMLDPLFIILSWTSMLDSLPGINVTDCIVSPSLQAVEVGMGFFKTERSSSEGDVITFEELVFDMRTLIGIQRVFGIASDVYSV